jgi:polyhydroxyalkanoate synthesis regulator phasin
MHDKSSTNLRWRPILLVFLVGFALLSVFRISSIARAGEDPNQQQDVIRLENRLTQLEQRLFTIENSLRNLEQQSRLANVTSRSVNQDDLVLLRSEVQALQRRLAEDECGLAKLDERTLAPQRRDARKKSGAGDSDPCRLNFDTPLRFP